MCLNSFKEKLPPWKDLEKDGSPKPISAWTAVKLHRGNHLDELHLFFFPLDCHSRLLTVCGERRVAPQPMGRREIFKVSLLEANNSRLEADFFFNVLFLEARIEQHPQRSPLMARQSQCCLTVSCPSSWDVMWLLDSPQFSGSDLKRNGKVLCWEFFLHFYSQIRKPYHKRWQAISWH